MTTDKYVYFRVVCPTCRKEQRVKVPIGAKPGDVPETVKCDKEGCDGVISTAGKFE